MNTDVIFYSMFAMFAPLIGIRCAIGYRRIVDAIQDFNDKSNYLEARGLEMREEGTFLKPKMVIRRRKYTGPVHKVPDAVRPDKDQRIH